MSAGRRRRLDAELVRRGLAANRRLAQDAVSTGRVLVAGAVADRPARLVAPTEPLELVGPPPRYVSRGGDKLAGALDRWGIDPAGRTVLDAGASTGGFTDCLLQRGARLVVALDVGHGQLDARLRTDPRVVVVERTNLRTLDAGQLAADAGGVVPLDMVTADLSFISLTVVAPVLAGPVVRAGGELVVLVKPQFEVGRAVAGRGRGVVRDPDQWLAALRAVASSLTASGAAIMGAMPSPLQGAAGNVEFFLRARPHATSGDARGRDTCSPIDTLLETAVAEAAAGRGPARPAGRDGGP